MTEEPEAELQATANLSPVSPSPVHTASPLVVPALQDTVDSINAMVAAAAASHRDSRDAVQENGVQGPPPPIVPQDEGDQEFVDDDNDPYDDGATDEPVSAQAQAGDASAPVPPVDEDNGNDDYAKTFDSPVNPEEGDGYVSDAGMPRDVSSVPREESNKVPSSTLTSHPSDTSRRISTDPSELPTQPNPSATQLPEEAEDYEPTMHTAGQTSHPATPQADGAAQAHPPVDLRQLVADLSLPSPGSHSNRDPPPSLAAANPEQDATPSSQNPAASALPAASSLPPRPPQPSAPSQTYPSQHHPTGSGTVPSAAPGQTSQYVPVAAPGVSPTEAVAPLPTPPIVGLNSAPAPVNPPASYTAPASASSPDASDGEYQQRWEKFLGDERQYMSEAKWDRFPEGSRIFIGNLSSDKVSKRDVFDLFHRFGRLAQISLKSAYGFVQYHTVDEGHRAIDNLQNVEIKGRRIHLEISKLQDKSKRERGRSPDKGRDSRGGREGGRRGDRLGSQRDEYRNGRNHSPRRSDHHDGHGRDRGFRDSGRGRERSRSPAHGRGSRDSYRRRSPSPYRHQHHEPVLDLPKRFGADVPDVQVLLQAGVSRDFVAWVESAFKAKGLTTHNMFLHPRMPKDQVIQRQAAEGVHAVVDLDMHSQNTGKIPVQAFDRSAGSANVRFDQYVDLDPGIAAEVIMRTKASGAPAYGQTYGAAVPGAGYPQGYGAPPPASGNPYGAPPQQMGGYPPQQQHQQHQQQSADIAALIGKVDPATLQQLISTLQPSVHAAASAPPPSIPHAAPQAGQPDLQAILSSLSGGNHPAAAPPVAMSAVQYGPPYGAQPPPNAAPPPGPPAGGESAAQVQNIMAQLARYRQ